MFFLLYGRPDDGVFYDISDHFPKISEDHRKLFRRAHERCMTFTSGVFSSTTLVSI